VPDPTTNRDDADPPFGSGLVQQLTIHHRPEDPVFAEGVFEDLGSQDGQNDTSVWNWRSCQFEG